MHLNEIDALARELMLNNVTDIQVGRCALALEAHASCAMSQASQFKRSEIKEGSLLEGALDRFKIDIPDQDMLYAVFDLAPEELTVLFFPQTDIAILVKGDQWEPVCSMPISNFFRYLSTIPNPFLFASQDDFMGHATPEGLHLLQVYAADLRG